MRLARDYQHNISVKIDNKRTYRPISEFELVELTYTYEQIVDYKAEYERLVKVLQNYCYIDNYGEGEFVKMLVEAYDSSNMLDFEYLKHILES